MAVRLDRMTIDDVATNPERIAAEIHRQLGNIDPPIPVYEIARALDIEEIDEKPTRNFEAALMTEPERDFGIVLLNSLASRQRRRYSLGHELGHFLCAWHKPTEGEGFRCTRSDMTEPRGGTIHRQQEDEANRFAIELLAPTRLVRRHLRRLPDLDHVLAMHSVLDISKAAAVRRYVALHAECLAVMFAKNGALEYVIKGEGFPWLNFSKGDRLPSLPGLARNVRTSEMVEADAEEWFGPARRSHDLSVQYLPQEDERGLILLHLASQTDEDPES